MMIRDFQEGVFEHKFAVGPHQVAPVLEWMRSEFEADPHGTGAEGDGYLVQSVYLDTPAFDVFHRRGSFGRAKFRVRRYGVAETVFLERKLKRGGLVRKRRVEVDSGQLDHLRAAANGVVWPGSWFHHRLAVRGLRPVIRMSYDRVARLGWGAGGRIRVTLDRALRAESAAEFELPWPLSGVDLFRGGAVLEIKFGDTLPPTAKVLVEKLGLAAGAISKYRTGVRACGLVADPESGPGAGPTAPSPVAPGPAPAPAADQNLCSTP